ncbi:glycosyltransferase [Clostridium beijerinckii]|uniref:Glycosyltransferase involved in cell wall biosynthesis n=1 Tax=Clostridium beijerinckii TaxID=1520 RepID=A0AAE5H1Z0_CLOBE|nr:glycosyltransferase [Clostridium beijerinckii]NSB12496.1 glycosyltransferase involved in cell wall biosynthesis [Clostridium beijerinckii]OOM33888.1 putative glycosyltransferase EpsJ [Clostridium beijerinckii]
MKDNLVNIVMQSKDELINDTENLKEDISCAVKDKMKLVFFVRLGLDSFLGDIIEGLPQEYEIKKIIVTEYKQIEDGMQWADICWFEWCDELIAYGSKLELAREKKVICRLHSYEAFTDYINNVTWNSIDKLIVVGAHIKDFIVQNFNIDEKIISVIPNGIDEKKWTYKERENGFNIAYVGYINYKKGPMLLLHTFKAIYDEDNRYKLYIAGVFQDNRDVLYYNQMVRGLGLENNVIYEGWQNDLDKWLEDKNYILCTSVLESQNMSVMQAMCKGIKPIIHNFVGAKKIYGKEYLWNTIKDAVNMICSDEYKSIEYRKFIEDNYLLEQQITKIRLVITKINLEKEKFKLLDEPLVTVGIINYNYSEFLDKSIESVLKQNYKNIEIIITDDSSSDDSVEKIKSYENKYENINAIYHASNSGNAYRGIEEIIKYARGKYFMFLSSDDFLSDSNVIKMYVSELLLDSSIDYVFGNISVYNDNNTENIRWTYRNYTDDEIISETFNRKGSGVVPFSVGLYKKEFFDRNKITLFEDKNNKVAGDTLNTLAYLKYGWKIKYINYDAVSYRHHNNNMTYDLENRIKSIISVMEYIVENFSETKYLINVDWSNLNEKNKESTKNYLIGVNYYNTYIMYLSGNGMPWKCNLDFDIEQIKVYLQPLINIIEKYMKKSLTYGDLYCNEINKILNEIKPYKLDIKVNKNDKEYMQQVQIIDKGEELRGSLLEKYKNKYKRHDKKILIYSVINGFWKYSFLSWKQVLNYMGIKADVIYEVNQKLNYEDYDIYINLADKIYIDNSFANKSIERIKNKIGIASKQDNDDLDLINIQKCKDFNYKFLISPFHEETYISYFKNLTSSNINIESVPFGFNPLIYYPENTKKIYDYFFVGTNSYLKYKETEKYLIPILNKYKNGILRGSGWGNINVELNPDNSKFFYNRSKINLNYHLDIQKKMKNEVNERTFIIGACGGFQIVDNPKLIYELYTKDDIAIANDEYEYAEMFKYYLNKPLERYEKAYNSLVKTYENKYSLFDRLEKILQLIL